MWELLQEYEDASGMKANKSKFEGIRCGKLRKVTPPTVPGLYCEHIAWVKQQEYVRILGIPFYEEYDEREFWTEKYSKMKKLLAAWKGHTFLTIVGANMLCNSMIMGRFRYYVQALAMPDEFTTAIEADCQNLVWSKD